MITRTHGQQRAPGAGPAHEGPAAAALVIACTMLLPWCGPQRARWNCSPNTIGTLQASRPAAPRKAAGLSARVRHMHAGRALQL
jgi:hypothetical protein